VGAFEVEFYINGVLVASRQTSASDAHTDVTVEAMRLPGLNMTLCAPKGWQRHTFTDASGYGIEGAGLKDEAGKPVAYLFTINASHGSDWDTRGKALRPILQNAFNFFGISSSPGSPIEGKHCLSASPPSEVTYRYLTTADGLIYGAIVHGRSRRGKDWTVLCEAISSLRDIYGPATLLYGIRQGMSQNEVRATVGPPPEEYECRTDAGECLRWLYRESDDSMTEISFSMSTEGLELEHFKNIRL
jgi:hypothetical protein